MPNLVFLKKHISNIGQLYFFMTDPTFSLVLIPWMWWHEIIKLEAEFTKNAERETRSLLYSVYIYNYDLNYIIIFLNYLLVDGRHVRNFIFLFMKGTCGWFRIPYLWFGYFNKFLFPFSSEGNSYYILFLVNKKELLNFIFNL